MKNLLSFSIPGYTITPPATVPTGGLGAGENGQKALQVGLELLFIVGIVLSIVLVIFSGIQWILSGGDKEKIQSARNRLVYSIIGLIIIVASFFIASTVITLLGGDPKFFFNIPVPNQNGFTCVDKNCSANETCVGSPDGNNTYCIPKDKPIDAYCGTPNKSPNNEVCQSGNCNPQTLRCD